jgi:hypothetical protein
MLSIGCSGWFDTDSVTRRDRKMQITDLQIVTLRRIHVACRGTLSAKSSEVAQHACRGRLPSPIGAVSLSEAQRSLDAVVVYSVTES